MIKKLALAALLATPALAPAHAGRFELGVLRCSIDGGTGYIIASNKGLDCTFRHSRTGATEHYTGMISKLGVDLGKTDQGELVWAVFAPTWKYDDGNLAGSYYGVNAEAAVVTGGGLNVLAGGFQNSINLQPLSAQAQTGLNVAVAVASLDLIRSYK